MRRAAAVRRNTVGAVVAAGVEGLAVESVGHVGRPEKQDKGNRCRSRRWKSKAR